MAGPFGRDDRSRFQTSNSLMTFLLLFSLVLTLAGFTALGTPFSAEAQAQQDGKQEESIGVATMKDDGTIILRLRTKSRGGAVGEGSLVYPPTHPEYQNILSHIGTIRRGETVPVKPWPD